MRNFVNEARWQKEKYKKFGFTIDRKKGERFVETLERIGKTPLEWFKEQVDEWITVGSDDTTAVHEDTAVVSHDGVASTTVVKWKPPPTPDEKEKWEEEYNNGLPPKRIAEMFRRDARAVKRHLQAVGLME